VTESTYIHGTSPEEQRRLSLMNDVLLNPASIREMALRGDERIIDFGSGLGQFSRAMARAVPRGLVVGVERDEDLGDEWGTFDVAHTRFVLEHVPDPLRVVQAMVRAVRPGGRIILADDDHDVIRLWPEPPGFYDLWRAYIRTYDRIGNDPFIGRRLVQLLHDAGAAPKRNTIIFFGGCAGMEIFDVLTANMIGVVKTARETILSMSLYDPDLLDVTLRAYETWARRPDAAIWFGMSWAEGVKVPSSAA
jgi:hypothetical protein